MKIDTIKRILFKSINEQEILMGDERFISINEKTSYSVSKAINWLLIALLFITGAMMKNYTSVFIVALIIIAKFTLTIIYSFYYSNKI